MNTITVTDPMHLERALRHAAAKMNKHTTWWDTLFTISNPATEVPGGVKRRALRGWIEVGKRYNTLQVTLDMSDPTEPRVKGAWSPGPRTLAKEGPSYLTWDTESITELKGMHALYSSETIWVGGYEWGKDRLVLVIYRDASGQ